MNIISLFIIVIVMFIDECIASVSERIFLVMR